MIGLIAALMTSMSSLPIRLGTSPLFRMLLMSSRKDSCRGEGGEGGKGGQGGWMMCVRKDWGQGLGYRDSGRDGTPGYNGGGGRERQEEGASGAEGCPYTHPVKQH